MASDAGYEMAGGEITFPSEETIQLPLPREFHPTNVKAEIAKAHQVLTVYENYLHGLGSHYACVKYKDSSPQYCIARPFEKASEARRIYGLMTRCKHTSILQPLGIWICQTKVKWKKPKKDEKSNDEKVAEDKKEGTEKNIEAFITFPHIDGALTDVPAEDIFLVGDKTAYGLTSQGSNFFTDILSVIEHINGLYTARNASPDSIGTPFPLCSLRFNAGRIVYNELSQGKYKVLFWVDFFTEDQERKKYKKEPTVEDIRLANWKTVGTYLTSLLEKFGVKPNEELNQLAKKLSGEMSNVEEALRYIDSLWEPGMWSVYTKIHFIREVFWCCDNSTERVDILKSKGSLGLGSVITKLGFANPDNNLYDSLAFLRKKVVAHQDSTYREYKGVKDDVGIDKRTILTFVQKIKPSFMIQLVKEVRQLHWIQESPLLRSETAYMQPFKSK